MLSFYGNYIESLSQGGVAPSNADNAGQVFSPYKTKQLEAGVKLDFGRFATALSAFQITVPTGVIDPATNTFGVYGEQRHRGLEWSNFGEIYPGVRILGGVTYIDAELTKSVDPTVIGHQAVGVPHVQLNLGAEWDTPFIPGLALSTRVIHNSSFYMDTANVQKIPDWTQLDLGVRYKTRIASKPVTFRASLTNVFNANYWEANPAGYLTLSSGRALWVSATTDF